MELLIPLSRCGEPLFRQLYLGLRDAIMAGSLRKGERVPSTRELAERLGVSRTVVVLAYDQLAAEGFIAGRGGSGTYVREALAAERVRATPDAAKFRLSRFGLAANETAPRLGPPAKSAPGPVRIDFSYGSGDVELFPFEPWRRMLIRNARTISVRGLDYGASIGDVALREAIAGHLRRSRAVVCDPAQVIVVNGSQQGLDLVVRVLVERGDTVVVEDPLYQGTRKVLQAAGARIRAVAVDREGLDPTKLPRASRMCFVTPSHQFPTGAILPLSRRLALLKWAERNSGVLVEDDYDGEFRYDGQALESLQGLDAHGRVIYMGTFSRTVFPSLRIGYIVVPKPLVPAFSASKWLSDRHTATLEQRTLAEFISSGMYERHLRRVRRRNAARRKTLLEAIQRHLGNCVEVTGDGAGAHVVLWPHPAASEDKILARAVEAGVRIYGISGYFVRHPSPAGFMLGYARLKEREIKEGIRLLAQASVFDR